MRCFASLYSRRKSGLRRRFFRVCLPEYWAWVIPVTSRASLNAKGQSSAVLTWPHTRALMRRFVRPTYRCWQRSEKRYTPPVGMSRGRAVNRAGDISKRAKNFGWRESVKLRNRSSIILEGVGVRNWFRGEMTRAKHAIVLDE